MSKTIQLRFLNLCIIMLIAFTLSAQDSKELNVGRVSPGEIDYAGFKLDQDATINIKGTGASLKKWGNNLVFYGWIIESKSREVVWTLLDEYENKFFHEEGSFPFDINVKLKKGSYEVYYTAMFSNSYYRNYSNGVVDVVKEVLNSIIYDDNYDSRIEKNYMTVTCDGNGFTTNNGREHIDNMAEKSIVSFVRARDKESEYKSFALDKETKIYIYSLGERDRNEFYDFAWIYDLRTHEKVWPNKSTDYTFAGGGAKNFAVFQEIVLPKGDYQVNYITDDSHSYERWNVMPPNDPQFWGITVWCDKEDNKNVSTNVKEDAPVVDLTMVRDDEFVSQGFEITEPTDLRLICLGESMDYDPDDYGWIIDAKTRKTIWKFTKAKSEYAGGADKNRMVNEVISLQKGKYIAYFVSDGSHSYHNWNAAPPHDQKLWGLSLWAVNDKDKSNVKLFKEEEFADNNVIAEIVKVRDNEKEYKEFSIDKEMKVRVYAIGEGRDGDMFDTGWIKNMDSGKIVWEMTYRTTEHAGGVMKNRLFNDYILLKPGNYRLYYETDSSHSFMDWNDDPPEDQMNYGIKILKD